MKLIPLKQKDSEACGPTCIKMTADYLQYPLSLNKINKISQYKKHGGLSNKQFLDTVKNLGLQIRTTSNSHWENLKKYKLQNTVIIVSWMLRGYIGHFSVVKSLNKNYITLADPQVGKMIKLPKIIFLRLWFDYDELWYPKKNTDIQLRWMAIISKK